MQSAVLQIKTAYEVNGMTVEEICQDQNMEVTVVKAALMNCSTKYRKDCGQEDDSENGLNFSNQQLRDVNREIYNLAMSSEDEHVRVKLLTYIRDDKKGRKEVVRQLANNNTFNFLQLNESLAAAREARKRLVEV